MIIVNKYRLSLYQAVLLLVIFPCFLAAAVQAKEVINLKEPFSHNDKRGSYVREILNAALLKVYSSPDEFELNYQAMGNEERTKALMVHSSAADVTYSATRKEWESDLIPIRIPLYKGLMGMRVLLIKQGDQATFLDIDNVEQLKSLTMGVGHIWAITKVFRHNKFNVVTGANYDGLFEMLKKGRFDYFPRGITEVFVEYQHEKPNFPQLHIESSLLINTALPFYFFVAPQQSSLAKKLTQGLELIVADGTFERIFNKYYGESLLKLNINKRKIFNIKNPDLSPATIENINNYWKGR